jgi:hypothetical protein
MFAKKGQARVNKVLDSFTFITKELELGIKECKAETSLNKKTISALETRNTSLLRTVSKAENLKGSIENLLGKP